MHQVASGPKQAASCRLQKSDGQASLSSEHFQGEMAWLERAVEKMMIGLQMESGD